MKTGITAVALLALVLGGCTEDDEDDFFDDSIDESTSSPAITTPTLIVANQGDEAALLELWYDHDGIQTYQEATVPAGGQCQRTYSHLGTVKLIAGRVRDGLLLIEGTYEKADFRDNLLRIEIRP